MHLGLFVKNNKHGLIRIKDYRYRLLSSSAILRPRRANDETFNQAVEQVSRVVNDVRQYFIARAPNSYDALALEDALQIEKRESRGLAHLRLQLEAMKIARAPRVRGAVLVAPRGSGKSEAVDRGLAKAKFDPSTEGTWMKRLTFAEFMEDSRERLLMFRQDKSLPLRDPVPYLVHQLIKSRLLGGDGLRLLIIEDVQVSSMVDALILRRLFKGLLGFGTGLVLTTPRPPSTWYSYGVDSYKLTPFIDMIESNSDIVRLDTRFKSVNPLL